MFPWADFQHYLVIQGCFQGLLQWPWTKWPQTSDLFYCSVAFEVYFCWFHCVCLFHVLSPSSVFLLICCGLEKSRNQVYQWGYWFGCCHRDQWSAVQRSSPPGQCETQVLNVCWLSSPRVLSLQHHQSCPPPPSLCPRSSLHRGKEEWRACSFFLRMWPRSEVTSTHIPLART